MGINGLTQALLREFMEIRNPSNVEIQSSESIAFRQVYGTLSRGQLKKLLPMVGNTTEVAHIRSHDRNNQLQGV